MKHTPGVIETKEVNNEQIAYRIVCCGEKCSPGKCKPNSHSCEDSWHTMTLLPTKDEPRTHEQQLEEIKIRVAQRHEAKVAWRQKQISAKLPSNNN